MKISSIYYKLHNLYYQYYFIPRWDSQAQKKGYLKKKIQRGIRMRLFFESKMCKLIYFDDFEKAEQRFINKFLRPGDIFVDVGANIGLFTLIAAKLVGKRGHVYAFEPSSRIHQRLIDNIKLNNLTNVSCYQLALSDRDGEAILYVPLDGYDAWSSFGKPYQGGG